MDSDCQELLKDQDAYSQDLESESESEVFAYSQERPG